MSARTRSGPSLSWTFLGVVALVVCLTPLEGTAQPSGPTGAELIVRATDDAPAGFLRRLRNPSAKQSADSLFAGVISSRATLPQVAMEKSGGWPTEPPIPVYTLTVADSSALARVRERFQGRVEVQYAHPNVSYEIDSRRNAFGLDPDPVLGPGNAFADSLDHLSVIRALEGWDVTAGTTSVSIGVVDTGIYLQHPDLASQFWVNEAEDVDGNGRLGPADRSGVDEDGNGYVDDVIGYDFVDRPEVVRAGEYRNRDPDPSPDSLGPFSGHGTRVAGILSAAAADPSAGVVGVAPKTRLVPLRALAGDGRGRVDDIAAAVVYGASMGLDVLNLSFGRDHAAPLLEEAIEFAVEQGTIVVASAGNAGAVDKPHYPSDHPEVISVMWLAEDGEGIPDFSRSQHGIGVDLGAPGSNVFSTRYPRLRLLNGEPVREQDLYGSSSGSSFAAPQVAGAAALLRSADGTLSPASVRSILTGTAADIGDVSWSHTTGAGRLDVARGLLRSYPAQTELHAPEHNEGLLGTDPVAVVGTTLDPSFQSYQLFYAKGTRNLDSRSNPWRPLTEPVQKRVHRDTLTTWDVTSLSEGEYTLRLVTTLTDGRTIEDRRRVVVDRSAPEVNVKFVGAGRVAGKWGIVADIATDDTVRAEMSVQLRGNEYLAQGDLVSSRHGLTWADESGLGGEARVQIELTNRSGLETEVERTVTVPRDRTNPSYFEQTETQVPNGYLLPEATDFDGDQLPEIVLNQFQNGGLSDTLRAFEWSSSGFISTDTLLASLIPNDVGDTNRDGLQELLLQVRGATVVLEQREGDLLPRRLLYADTSGVSPSLRGPSFYGALFANLDGDERGELVGNWKADGEQTLWRVLEREGDTFQRIAELGNPTAHDRPDTTRTSPSAATGDFDGDGRQDLLVGDGDGDWIIYEATTGGEIETSWTHETDRVGTDRRFAVGDVLGNGQPEFVTYATYDPTETRDEESEPEISYYSIWSASGPDEYERAYRLPVAGEHSPFGSITAADFDGDGRDEVAIAHPPSLFVLGASAGGKVTVLHEARNRPIIRSPTLTAADFTGDGVPSLVAATAGETLRRFVVNGTAVRRPPPQWVQAVPTGANGTRLIWRAPGADSVTVYGGPAGGPLDPVAVRTDSSVSLMGEVERRYSLRAWFGDGASPLSPARRVRPHAPAIVADVQYPSSSTVRVRFNEPIGSTLEAEKFTLASHGAPRAVLRSNNRTGVVLKFGDNVTGVEEVLRWERLVDTTGLPVGQTQVPVSFPMGARRSLFVEEAKILDEQRVELTFNMPVDGDDARAPSHYSVRPHGSIGEVRMEDDNPTTVTLRLNGIVVGATGQEASLTVSSIQSVDGALLVDEGTTVRLTRPADDLQDVYVYPNPVELTHHDPHLTVAGLPGTADVRIFHPSGRLVEHLSTEDNRTGGLDWDLRDRKGKRVPSGIYLLRVSAPNASPVLKKAAVVR